MLASLGRRDSRNLLKILYVDKITLSSLFKVWWHGRACETIWHFEPITDFSRRLLRLVQRLDWHRPELRQVENHIGQVPSTNGDLAYAECMADVREICAQIKRDHLAVDSLIESMSSTWEPRKVILYFEKQAEEQLMKERVRIALVGWMRQHQSSAIASRCVLLVAKYQWDSYLGPFARSQDIRVSTYRSLWDLARFARAAGPLVLGVRNKLPVLGRILRNRLRPRTETGSRSQPFAKPKRRRPSDSPTIGIRYWHRTLDLDPTKRSELFWLNESGIPYSDILIYDYVSDVPLDADIKAQMESHGIRILGRCPGVDSWRPTLGMSRVFLRLTVKLMQKWLNNSLRLHRKSSHSLAAFLQLAWRYAYWHDFYRANGIRVDVAVVGNRNVAQVLALDAMNGVSIGYQYAVGPFFPTIGITSGETVQIVFSQYFEKLYRAVEAPVDWFVHTGFIYDGAFETVRKLDRVAIARNRLEEHGANFILCFFDENSVPFWNIPGHDKDAADDYEFLLNWLLEDPTLGLVFKPKNSTNLFQRISSVSSLIDQAKQTGRAQFLTSETLYGSIYPTEASSIADVCVGKLAGCSAAFESRLAGTPTVLVDNDNFVSHPFNTWGRDRVVFDDWTSFRDALERFREDPKAYPEFGDWSPGMDELDHYQDGRASTRMGGCIGRIYNSLKQGDSKEAAMAAAASWYSQHAKEGLQCLPHKSEILGICDESLSSELR